MQTTDSFDFDSFKQEAMKELYKGRSRNKLNPTQIAGMKQAKSKFAAVWVNLSGPPPRLETPRDRVGSYEPTIVPKRQTILTDQLESKIISMYGRGMSYSDISAHSQELYGFSLSAGELSSITDRILPVLKEWQNRPLYSIQAR